MAENGVPTPGDGSKPFSAASCTKGVNSPSGGFSRDLPAASSHVSGLELTLGLGGLMVLAAVFTGHTIALAGLVGLVIAGNARARQPSPRTCVGQLTEGPERSDA